MSLFSPLLSVYLHFALRKLFIYFCWLFSAVKKWLFCGEHQKSQSSTFPFSCTYLYVWWYMESDQKKKYDMLKVGPTHLVLFNAYLYQISRKCLDFLNYSCSRIFICIRLWSIHLFIVFDFWEKLISHDRLIGAPTHSAKNDFRFQLWTKLEGNWQRNYIDIFSIWPLGNFKVRIVLLVLQ